VNFLFDDEQEMLRDSLRRLLQRTTSADDVRALLDSDTGFDAAAWKRAAELGSLSMLVPEKLGGGSLSGQGVVDAVLIAEEWGRALAPGPFLSTQVALHAISEYAFLAWSPASRSSRGASPNKAPTGTPRRSCSERPRAPTAGPSTARSCSWKAPRSQTISW
jgi:alkylation response protein AidB-like acyl-CoA dehydrogenase